jgi:lipopolysaccharide assembly protein A
MAILRFLSALVWGVVFLVLLLFALKNTDPVTVKFYFEQEWRAPLMLVVLAAFAAGAIFGMIACVPAFMRRHREIAGLKKELRLRPSVDAGAERPGTSGNAPPRM